MTAPATIEIKDEIATITMDDGKANAINPTMLEALNACLDQAEKEAKALIITGREGRFSGGFDLKLVKRSKRWSMAAVNLRIACLASVCLS